MRYTPMHIAEQCELEDRMLIHFELLPQEWRGIKSPSLKRYSKHFPKQAYSAISISQAFFAVTETDGPIDAEEMVLAIRYRLGYGWWAWLLIRSFAVPIIKWLWNQYHNPQPVEAQV